MMQLYSEQRLNEEWFLRSKGFHAPNATRNMWTTDHHDEWGISLRASTDELNGKRLWVASCSGRGYRSETYDTVEAAYVAGELANWGLA